MSRYYIPANFATDGKVGSFAVRNIIETAAADAVIAVPVVGLIPFPPGVKISVSVITLGLVTVIGLRGINGLSLFQFLADFIAFRRDRRVYGEPKPADNISREKRLMKKKEQIRRKQEKAEKQDRREKRIMDIKYRTGRERDE